MAGSISVLIKETTIVVELMNRALIDSVRFFEVVIICAIGYNIDRSPAKNDRSKVFWS